jgi:T-complex protein 1 subunit gamma
VLTNDGNAILREVDVTHPAAKSLIDLSRAVDEETGDGTTSVAIIAGEILSTSEKLLEANFHPSIIVTAYFQALEEIENGAQ